MLEQFTVENFKGFEKLTLDDLGHINIFVGKNNTGKTSLLQAVALNCIAESLQTAKEKDLTTEVLSVDASNLLGLHLKLNFNKGNYEQPICFKTKDQNSKNVQNDLTFKILKTTLDEEAQPSLSLNYAVNDQHLLIGSKINIDNINAYYISGRSVLDFEVVCFFGALTNYKMLAPILFEKVIEFRESIIKILQEHIEPNLSHIEYGRQNILLVKVKDKPLMPLDSMGDGFAKLLGLMTVFFSTGYPTICIDEPENGFHYSVQSQFWQLLATAGLEHGKQSFIATHSYELLESLNTLLNENPNLTKPKEDGGQGLKVRVYRLERNERLGTLEVITLDESELASIIEEHWELR